MALRDPLFLENAGAVYNAREYRAMFQRLYANRPGIFSVADLAVTQQSTPNIGVAIAAGAGMVKATGSGISGLYFVDNDATVNVSLAAPDATNPRRDIIGIRIRDSESSGSSNDGVIVAITGTPAASPADPALPNNFLVLARVAVAALASSIVNANITDLRRTTTGQGGLITAPGGTIICTSATRPTVGVEVGTHIFETDTTAVYYWSGSEWLLATNLVPHTDTALVTAGGGTTTSASYVNLPTRLRVQNFAKFLTGTKLVIRVNGVAIHSNGLGVVDLAVDIGGTDTPICLGLGVSQYLSGVVSIPGIAKGTIANIEIQWSTTGATATMLGNSRWTMSVEETF